MKEYPKIPSPFKRHVDGPSRNKPFIGVFSSPELLFLCNNTWLWTEKVDGTNIRIHWDGHKVTYAGRTGNSQIPAKLVNVLNELVPEELFEQKFGSVAVTLYGEGYGSGIASGGVYRPDQSFVLFDVLIDGWWLEWPNVEDIATSLGLDVVPIVTRTTIPRALDMVERGLLSNWSVPNSKNPTYAEGLVGTINHGLLTRSGERIMVKIKHKDFWIP